jgi:hypothetical protein
VTENVKDFDPPSRGAYAMPVVRTSEFLNRLLTERPERVLAAMQAMLRRNRCEPRTMPELLDTMATRTDLKGFAKRLNSVVPPEQRGSHPSLGRGPAAAFDGLAPADDAPGTTPEAREAELRNVEKRKETEQDR